jgi:subtilisin family serine protease
MKNFTLAALCLLTAFAANCQNTSKVNFHISRIISAPGMQHQQVNLLVKGDIATIINLAESSGGIVRYYYGDIATIRIPVNAIPNFISSPVIQRIETPGGTVTAMNDSMRSTVHVNEVHAGISPLPQGYDGTGVIVGIIDTGVDFTHPDLKDSSGNTRILHLWDQNKPVAANTPSYGYGQEWNNTEIDAGLAASHNDVAGFGHGTHVTGIASGDGSAINKNKGVAPKANIIEVAFAFNNVTDPTYMDAVDYIFTKAQAAGKPCVINASLGDYYGSHDGYDLQSQMISNMINQQPGRVMVASAGNAGRIPFHLGYNVTSDTTFTWIRHNTAYPATYFQLWGDTSDFKFIDFSIGADVNTTQSSFRGRLPFRDIFYNLGVFRQDTIFSQSGNRLAIVQSFGSIQGPAYSLEFNLIPDSAIYQWRLITTGSGSFDMWKFYDGTAQPGYINSALPAASVVPDIIHYKMPDSLSTIVSGLQCLDNVITVGNYGNRNSYVDYNGNTYIDPAVIPGQIAGNSSWGPTRDGRIKPDIAAPGGIMLSCGQLSLLQIWQTQPTNVVKIAEGGFHFRDGGTSSSSPVVAGIVALYLQKNPTATALQVKDAILNCAVQDNITGNNLPDNVWGYGKADAFNTLVNCSLTSMDENHMAGNSIVLYPNPVYSGSIIKLNILPVFKNGSANISITDVTGRIINTQEIQSNGIVEISTAGLAGGLYSVIVINNGERISAGRFCVLD